jgi:hypothetical protein
MGDKSRGLYEKFKVERTDGSSAPGGKHESCQYFVLDLTHDVHAKAAIWAYSESCQAQYPALARDLRAKITTACTHPIEWRTGDRCGVCLRSVPPGAKEGQP